MMESGLHEHFDTLPGYRAALASLIGDARHRLWIYERSLQEADLGCPAMHDLLWRFLVRSPAGRVRILVHNPDWLLNHSPRLMQLRERFAHLIEIRVAHEEMALLTTAIVLADEERYLKRNHFDWMRGEAGDVRRELMLLENQFALLWEHAGPPAGICPLGL